MSSAQRRLVAELIARIQAAGLVVTQTRSGHWKVTAPEGWTRPQAFLPTQRRGSPAVPTNTVFLPGSPSDPRSLTNCERDIRHTFGVRV